MWIKIFRQRKLQSILIFLIIAVCTTLLMGAVNILASLEKPYREFADECDAALAQVFPYDQTAEAVRIMGDQFKSIDAVDRVEYSPRHYIEETILFNNKKVEAFINLTLYTEAIFGKVRYLEGDKSAALNLTESECLLPAGIAHSLDIRTGDSITIKFASGDRVYNVKAVYSEPYQTSAAFDSDILVKELPADISVTQAILLYNEENVNGKQIEEAYRETYGGQLHGLFYSLEERIDNSLIVGRIIGALFLAIGIIMLLVSGLMIHYMLQNAMLTDQKTVAVYKTLGYTSRDILLMYLKVYFVVVTLASAVGILTSVFVSSTVLTTIYANMGQLSANPSLVSAILCYGFTCAFVVSIITSILYKTKHIKPAAILNGCDYSGVKKKNYRGNLTLPFSAGGIALRTFLRERRKALNILITCIVTIFSVNFAVISLDAAGSMKENNDHWLGIDKADVMISIPDSAQLELVRNAVSQDTRVDYSLESAFQGTVTLEWKKGVTQTEMRTFTYEDFDKANLPMTQGRNPASGNEIALSTRMAKELNKSIGDYVRVYLDGEKRVDLLVTGFFQTYIQLGTICRLHSSAYTDHGLDYVTNNLSVYLKDKADIDDFISDMKKVLGGNADVILRTEQYASIMNMITEPQMKAIPPMVALVLAVAAINIFSIVLLKNLRARRINGIYKCIGYTTGHLICSNLLYVGAIAVISAAVTLPISLLTYGPIMTLSLSMFNFTQYPVQFDYLHLLLVNLGIVGMFAVSTLVSSGELFKVNARDLVQE